MFRTLLDINEEPLIRNYRQVQNLNNRPVFHVSPSTFLNSTLLSFPKYNKNNNGKNKNNTKPPQPSTSFQSQKDLFYVNKVRTKYQNGNNRKNINKCDGFSCMCDKLYY